MKKKTSILVLLVIVVALAGTAHALSRVGVTTPGKRFPVRVSADKKVVLVTRHWWGPFVKVRYQVRTKYGQTWLFGQWRTKHFYFSGQGTGLRHVTRGVYVRCLPRSCRYGEMAVWK